MYSCTGRGLHHVRGPALVGGVHVWCGVGVVHFTSAQGVGCTLRGLTIWGHIETEKRDTHPLRPGPTTQLGLGLGRAVTLTLIKTGY